MVLRGSSLFDRKDIIPFIKEIAEIFLAEGSASSKVISEYVKYQEYKAKEGERQKLRTELNARLADFGLPFIPKDMAFGQRTIDKYYTEPVYRAVGRGQLFLDSDGIPRKKPAGAYNPVTELAGRVLDNQAEAMRTAQTIDTLETGALEYRATGAVGGLTAVSAELEIISGRWIVINGLMNPQTGKLVYAAASLGDGKGRTELISLGKLIELITQNGYSISLAEPVGSARIEAAERMLRAPPASQYPGVKPISCTTVSPGSGGWVSGIVTFDRKYMEKDDPYKENEYLFCRIPVPKI